jgi:hypothetical protein
VVLQVLTKEYLEKIGDQVKEVTEDTFHNATQQHEEMNKPMQEEMAELRQLLEATNITPRQRQRWNQQPTLTILER